MLPRLNRSKTMPRIIVVIPINPRFSKEELPGLGGMGIEAEPVATVGVGICVGDRVAVTLDLAAGVKVTVGIFVTVGDFVGEIVGLADTESVNWLPVA